ncbi:UNVERIFIED_CONTAM: hypothetical protein GTU68_028499 [Idotea baltica]|nr:hypothetical protein [Idotea baltica]
MPTIDFYYHPLSPPCQAILLVGEAIGLKFNLILIDTMEKKEHLTPEFIAMNPQHTLPTIVDGGLTLWESRAISSYLVESYAKNDNLYPKDSKIRAQIDRILFFDLSALYPRILKFIVPVVEQGTKPEQEKLDKLMEAVGYLDIFLEGHLFAVGNRITIADFALAASLGCIVMCGIEIRHYARVSSYYTRCTQQMRGYDKVFEEPKQMMKALFKGKLRM